MQEPNEVQNAEPVESEAATVEQQPSSDELENRVQQLEAEAASARDQLLRATADLRNYKRRVEDERTQSDPQRLGRPDHEAAAGARRF